MHVTTLNSTCLVVYVTKANFCLDLRAADCAQFTYNEVYWAILVLAAVIVPSSPLQTRQTGHALDSH